MKISIQIEPMQKDTEIAITCNQLTPEIEKMMVGIDLSGKGVPDDPAERDKIDASRADEINERFSEVVLNEEGEETFL